MAGRCPHKTGTSCLGATLLKPLQEYTPIAAIGAKAMRCNQPEPHAQRSGVQRSARPAYSEKHQRSAPRDLYRRSVGNATRWRMIGKEQRPTRRGRSAQPARSAPEAADRAPAYGGDGAARDQRPTHIGTPPHVGDDATQDPLSAGCISVRGMEGGSSTMLGGSSGTVARLTTRAPAERRRGRAVPKINRTNSRETATLAHQQNARIPRAIRAPLPGQEPAHNLSG